ncbi:putative E3 ubiquitin-protein ligase SINA-like 6 [Triticum aestivum]|uniref:putative E3 ubiquitin-protein ligase SINA-like 6 n=1 Tax=Triticum aestivum TaxID=4565 RepID=UPI001D01CF40|nr:putative E3 ubiquitin-protein ligase SINA-like 6 [Triticum aestivum]
MEVKSNGIKKDGKEGEALQEGQSIVKKQVVTMAMEVFDCPVCSTPLRPPIFQCSKGDFICSACHDKLPESERTASQRCYGMERVVNNIFVPCKYGCSWKITYYQKEGHERRCLKWPCICPVSDCDFLAPRAELLDHLTRLHEYPTKNIKYFVPFEIPVQPGSSCLTWHRRSPSAMQSPSFVSSGQMLQDPPSVALCVSRASTAITRSHR